MSLCTDCYDAGAFVNTCSTGLQFGEVQADTSYTVAVESLSTGKIQTFEVTSDEDGIITVDDVALAQRTTYTLWVTVGSINNTPVSLTIDTIEYECITFSVVSTSETDDIAVLTP
jgi:hypothetical protein